jgi:hypothetical protein
MRMTILCIAAALCAGCAPASSAEGDNAALPSDNLSTENLLVNDALSSGANADMDVAREAKIERADSAVSASASAELPSFDTVSYCRKIGDTAGGSMEIEATCREMEADALSGLSRLTIPARMLRYCTQIGETAGGSYEIMKTCVEMESEAATRL